MRGTPSGIPLPEVLKGAKERLKSEIAAIHGELHTVEDFAEFSKRARLDLQDAVQQLQRMYPRLVFKLGNVSQEVDPVTKKQFLKGSAYVGPRTPTKTSFFVSLNFTMSNEPVPQDEGTSR